MQPWSPWLRACMPADGQPLSPFTLHGCTPPCFALMYPLDEPHAPPRALAVFCPRYRARSPRAGRAVAVMPVEPLQPLSDARACPARAPTRMGPAGHGQAPEQALGCAAAARLIHELHDAREQRPRLLHGRRGRLGRVEHAVQARDVHLARDLGADVHQVVHRHACRRARRSGYGWNKGVLPLRPRVRRPCARRRMQARSGAARCAGLDLRTQAAVAARRGADPCSG